ncbi:MAG: PVC-type heme-binding CxxCH protein [Verrucomicrobiota bacterium]
MNSRYTILALLGLSFSHAFAAEISGGDSKSRDLKPAPRTAQPVLLQSEGKEETWRKSLRLKPGFVAQTWASEPMLGNPVAFTFDDQGRCFTSETNRYRTSVLDIRHYMFMLEDDLASRKVEDRIAYTKKNFPKDWQKLEQETEVVRLLEDTTGTGKADSSRVYADGLNTLLDGIASGIVSYGGKVWLTNIPNLWQFEGIAADGRAKSRKSLSFGWGVRYSYTGHDFHGLALGPDGRLYFSLGDRGAHIEDPKTGRTIIDLPDEGGIFRCEPDGANLELVMRGLRNPQETAFDNFGNLFTADNDADMGDRERFVYVVPGGDAGWRVGWQHHPIGKAYNPWMSEDLWKPRNSQKPQPSYLLSPILNIPDGPSGVAYYPGTGLPEEYNGHFFVCSFKGSSAKSSINHWSVKTKGADFAPDKEPEEFIGTAQATDVEFGPDSALYYSDWGTEGWEGLGRGRIYKIKHEAAYAAAKEQVEKVQSLLKNGFTTLPVEELSQLLAYPDQRIRLRAQWTLAGRAEAVPTFTKVLSHSKDRFARLHAIWGLGQVARADQKNGPGPLDVKPLTALLPLLKDSDSEIRANVLKVIGDCKAHTLTIDGSLNEFLKDPDSRVRFFAALAVGQTGATKSLPAVLEMLRENADADQYLRHAGVIALTYCADEEVLRLASEDATPAVRLAALLAYGRLNHPEIKRFLQDSSPNLVSEAAHVITDAPVPAAFPALAQLLTKDGLGEQIEQRALNAAFRVGTPEDAKAIVTYASDAKHAAGLRTEALTEIGLWATPPARDRVTGLYRPLETRPATAAADALAPAIAGLIAGEDAVAVAAIEAAGKLQATACADSLLEAAKNEKRSGKVRVAALEALSALNTPVLDGAITTALTANDSAVRTVASAILAKRDPNAAAAKLVAAWSSADAKNKKGLADTLADINSAEADTFFAKAVENLVQEPKEAHLEILEGAAKRKAPEVKAALAKYEASLPAGDLLAKFAPALLGGNRNAGEKLFKEHAVAACMRCHKVGGAGGDAGPNLDGFSKTHDRQYILESIVNVNAKIAPGFQMVMLTLKDGGFKAGLLKSENPTEISLQMPPAPAETIPVSAVAKREAAPSGMIPNIPDLITRRELRDIVEFVASLQ